MPADAGPQAALPAPFAALDIGGTTTRIALVLLDPHAHEPPTIPPVRDIATFPTEQRYDAQLTRIAAALDQLPPAERANLRGIGISVGARCLPDGSGVAVAPNLRDYEGRPLAADLARRTGLPVRLAHDTVCGLLGERHLGALLAHRTDAGTVRCAYLTLSTGTGAAVALPTPGGDMLLSIEFAHQVLDGNTRLCLCGQIGCLETYTGGRQLALRHGRPAEEISDPAVWDAFAEKLALGLLNLAQLTRAETVAIGGAIAAGRPGLLADVQARLDERLRGMPLRLVPAQLGERAPLLGAALLAGTHDAHVLA